MKILVGIFIGVLSTLLIQKTFFKFWNNFCNKASLIKKYWLFVIPFIILGSVSYFFVLKYSGPEHLQANLTILGQVLTLTFAIFVGYFAFLQVVSNKLANLRERGYANFRKLSYVRAIQCYEEAHLINSKDYNILANLVELYLITQAQEKLEKKLKLLEEIVIEDEEKICYYYLKTARFLFKEDLKTAKEELKVLIEIAKRAPLSYVPWGFDEIQKTEIYRSLTGDAKKILVNLIKYISKQLTPEQQKSFESGNYTV
jgi:tetratricopeptide (TPR) repeat protein